MNISKVMNIVKVGVKVVGMIGVGVAVTVAVKKLGVGGNIAKKASVGVASFFIGDYLSDLVGKRIDDTFQAAIDLFSEVKKMTTKDQPEETKQTRPVKTAAKEEKPKRSTARKSPRPNKGVHIPPTTNAFGMPGQN